jgi:hypothetical protein
MADLDTHSRNLELLLLRHAVGALQEDRSRCADCGRTPLAGEWIHIYSGRRRRMVCELCRMLRRDEPLESTVLRDGQTGNVRITKAAA